MIDAFHDIAVFESFESSLIFRTQIVLVEGLHAQLARFLHDF